MNKKKLTLIEFFLFLIFSINTVLGLGSESIVNGYEALDNKFNYHAFIYAKVPSAIYYRSVCGGVIVDEFFLLSAAHCVIDNNNNFIRHRYEVKIGTNDINYKPGILVDIDAIYVHKDYNHNTSENDIAIIKSIKKRPLTDNDSHIKKLRLSRYSGFLNDDIATVSGFGFTRIYIAHLDSLTNFIREGSSDYILKYTFIKVLDNHLCELKHQEFVSERELCGKSIIPGSGVCYGDSDSPLVINLTVVGILSRIRYDCSDYIFPPRYIRVSYFTEFIDSVIAGNPPYGTYIYFNPLRLFRSESSSMS